MAVASDAKRRERLLHGHKMTCPRCRVENNILKYIPMGIIEEFAEETNPIYKCPECRWVFSPSLTPAEHSAFLDLIQRSRESHD